MQFDTIKMYFSTTNAQVIALKTISKFTLKQLRHVSVQSRHLQGAHYPCLLKLQLLKLSIMAHKCVIKLVVMWLRILVVSLLMCVCVAMFGSRLVVYSRTVWHIYIYIYIYIGCTKTNLPYFGRRILIYTYEALNLSIYIFIYIRH